MGTLLGCGRRVVVDPRTAARLNDSGWTIVHERSRGPTQPTNDDTHRPGSGGRP
jgi:hypothetical protein